MNQNLPFEVLRQLRAQGKTLATAESCTGGLIGKLLTDVPGSSEVYMGGVISYTNGVKHRLLGVSEDDPIRLLMIKLQDMLRLPQ